MIPVLFGVTFLAFLLDNALPGNIVYQLLGDNPSKAALHQLQLELGLNRPPVQRYFDWLWQLLHGNLGHSLLGGQAVGTEIWSALPPTLELLIGAEVISLLLCLTLAFWSVWTRNRVLDRFITVLSLLGHCAPGFVVGLVALLIFSVKLKLVHSIYYPMSDGVAANLKGLVLPIVTLAIGIFPTQMRIFRGDMLQQLDHEDYVSLARLKGLTKGRIVMRHVAKNAAPNLITVIALSLGFLFGGVVIIEQVFTIPGVGGLLYSGITDHNAPIVQGIVLLIGVVVVVANLLADLIYMLLDPRVRYES
jgi:peptide/nickel transport system permease protein